MGAAIESQVDQYVPGVASHDRQKQDFLPKAAKAKQTPVKHQPEKARLPPEQNLGMAVPKNPPRPLGVPGTGPMNINPAQARQNLARPHPPVMHARPAMQNGANNQQQQQARPGLPGVGPDFLAQQFQRM